MSKRFYEQDFEQSFMDELTSLQYTIDYGPDISAGSLFEERRNAEQEDFSESYQALYCL